MTPPIPTDRAHAFVGPPAMLAEGAPDGPLEGLRLAVKDMIDVAGTVTGAGNPTFAASRQRATRHATAVARLVAAGATVIGKTITDEFAYSLSGTNVHFGTPANVAAPGRTPGGSSAGSAAAVAAFLARQGMEVWRSDGPWVEAHWSSLGPGIRARFKTARTVTAGQVEQADAVCATVRRRVEAVTTDGRALIMPASSGPAPAPGMDPDAYAAVRLPTLCLTALAGLAGAPVVALPLAQVHGLPLGLAVIGAPGHDRPLLDLAATVVGAGRRVRSP